MTPVRTLMFIALTFALMGCDEEKPKNHYVLKEAVHVKGTCSENHVGQPDRYAGQIVRWETKETGKVSTYGSVMRINWQQRTLDEVMHPTVYHTPLMISFVQIDIDTSQPNWTLHGVSKSLGDGDDVPGYDSTCEFEVVKRDNKVWEAADLLKALKD